MSILIHLERFEGPLGLLLHLVRKEEMDVFDININHITMQYLEYIKAMKQLDLEVAGEFIAMAATLIHIKSRMLLPQYNEDGEQVEDDPRKELIHKLLEYEKFQEVSKRIYERPLLGRDLWARGRREDIMVEDDGEIIMEDDNALFALISTYRLVVRNLTKSIHKVMGDLQSLASRIMELRDDLIPGRRANFSQLIRKQEPGERRNQMLVTFLSLLELGKMGFVSMFQSQTFHEIYIETKKTIDKEVTAQVEEYDRDQSNLAKLDVVIEANAMTDDNDEDTHQQEMFVATEQEAEVVEAATDEEIFAETQRLEIQDIEDGVS